MHDRTLRPGRGRAPLCALAGAALLGAALLAPAGLRASQPRETDVPALVRKATVVAIAEVEQVIARRKRCEQTISYVLKPRTVLAGNGKLPPRLTFAHRDVLWGQGCPRVARSTVPVAQEAQLKSQVLVLLERHGAWTVTGTFPLAERARVEAWRRGAKGAP